MAVATMMTTTLFECSTRYRQHDAASSSPSSITTDWWDESSPTQLESVAMLLLFFDIVTTNELYVLQLCLFILALLWLHSSVTAGKKFWPLKVLSQKRVAFSAPECADLVLMVVFKIARQCRAQRRISSIDGFHQLLYFAPFAET